MFNLFASALTIILMGAGLSQSTPMGRFAWIEGNGGIGGMSAIEVADDGMNFVALSDRGILVTGTFVRDDAGEIDDITNIKTARINVAQTSRNGPTARDSEGIAVGPDGTIYISFEGAHRVASFADINAAEVTLPDNPAFADLQMNSSLEALAMDADGALFTMPERSGRYDRPFPVYRLIDGVWDTPYALPRLESFLIVGADFGPDGLLYVLERDFTGFGFLNRVRRINLAAGTSDTVVLGRGQFGNLEGISVWRDAQGDLVITMIADNNNSFFLPTEIVEFRIEG